MKTQLFFLTVLMVATISCGDKKTQKCQLGHAQEIREWLIPLKELPPGKSQEINSPNRDCNGVDFNSDSVINEFCQENNLRFEDLPGVKVRISNTGDPCAEKRIRASIASEVEKQKGLESGKSKKLSRGIPTKCTEVNYKQIMKEEFEKVGIVIEFTGVNQEDGVNEDLFTISRPK